MDTTGYPTYDGLIGVVDNGDWTKYAIPLIIIDIYLLHSLLPYPMYSVLSISQDIRLRDLPDPKHDRPIHHNHSIDTLMA